MFIKDLCACGKELAIKSTYEAGLDRFSFTACCNKIIKNADTRANKIENFRSLDNKGPYKYQCDGVEFFNNASIKHVLIADEMGLGKTIQALGVLATNPELKPVLIVVKASIKRQWAREIIRWVNDEAIVQIIDDSKEYILPKCDAYIITYELLARMKNFDAKCEQLGVKLLILDECQQIKNEETKRSIAVRNLSKRIPKIIALSGTPIKNNAAEYWNVLNILQPTMFPNKYNFTNYECQSYWNGRSMKVGGLVDPEGFKRKTKHFILRRTRDEVLPDLPKIARNPLFFDLADKVERLYAKAMTEFMDEYNAGEMKMECILAYMSRMRHITGLSKIDPCVEFVEEFLQETDRLITVFVHHKDVADIIKIKLEDICSENGTSVVNLSSDMSQDERQRVIDKFLSGQSRVLIASTLASGEGLNLQKCSDMIMLERQWNPANEEQAEGRFSRIGSEASSINATYMLVTGTIDEYFAELVERKRQYVAQTLGQTDVVEWDESNIMRELADIIASKGAQRWRL